MKHLRILPAFVLGLLSSSAWAAEPTAPVDATAPATVEAAPAPVEPAAAPAAAPTGAKVTAEFGKGITIGTQDDAYTLNTRVFVQTLAQFSDPSGPSNDVFGIQARRMRLFFSGNVLGKKLTYNVQLGFSNRDTESDMRIPLLDAFVTYAAHRDLNVRVGQMLIPYGRERLSSDTQLSLADRSAVVNELNLDRDTGLLLFSKDLFGLGERLGYSVGVFGGEGRNRVALNSGVLVAGRLNITPFGSFDEFTESDIDRGSKPRLAIGLGAAYNHKTNRPDSTTITPYADPSIFFSYMNLGADFAFKWHGFFATGELMMRDSDKDSLTGTSNGLPTGTATTYYARKAWGGFAQVGQMLTENIEIAARYGHLEPKGTTDPNLKMLQELGGGLSYYFLKHNLKVQGDYFYLSSANDFANGTSQVRLSTSMMF